MAIEISERTQTAWASGKYLLRLLILLAPVRNRLNQLLRRISTKRTPRRKLAGRVSKNFDAVADHYKQHRWAFIEDIFENDYYEALKNNFPPRRFFRPVAFLEKSYDMLVVSDDTVRSLDSFPELQSLYSLFKSEPFCARIQAITGQQERERERERCGIQAR